MPRRRESKITVPFGPEADNRVPGEVIIRLSREGELQITESIPSGPIRRITESPPTRFGVDALDKIVRKFKIASINKVHTPFSNRTLSGAPGFISEELPGIVARKPSETRMATLAEGMSATYRLRFEPTIDIEEAVTTLTQLGTVTEASPNYFRTTTVTPNDTMYNAQWGLVKINCPEAWDINQGSASVVVAVVDTGVDLNHPDLQPNVIPGYDAVDLVGVSPEPGWHFEGDFLTRDNNPEDENGHGTHVAGTISAITNNTTGVAGVTWNCQIMPVKVLARMVHNTMGWVTGVGTATDIAAGIRYAADNGAHIINLSLGGYHDTFVERDAVAYAIANGCVVIAAMGNDNLDGADPHYPAAYDDVVAVGAINQSEQRISLGNTGGVWGSNMGPYIDVVAPGLTIRSTDWDNIYSDKSGTSMATPHVSGVAALIKSCDMSLSGSQIAEIIRNTARPLKDDPSDPVPNENYGYGLVDAKSALESAHPTPQKPSAQTRLIVKALSEDTIAAPGNRQPNYIVVSVSDTSGSPVTGLTLKNFKVDPMIVGPGGALVNITSVTAGRLPGFYNIHVVPIKAETWKKGVYIFCIAIERERISNTQTVKDRGQTLAKVLMD